MRPLKYIFIFVVVIMAWGVRLLIFAPSAERSVSQAWLSVSYVFAETNLGTGNDLNDTLDLSILQGRYLEAVEINMLAVPMTSVQQKAKTSVSPLLWNIIQCESGWKPQAVNPTSGACGLAQFIPSTWKSTMKKMGLPEDSNCQDYDLNLKAAIYLFNEQGTQPWVASQSCWLTK